jgi:hypothetical protein
LDAGLLAAAQAVEHYEMSRYGTLRTWAEELGHRDAATLLEATLEEEKKTDAALTALAEFIVNLEAGKGDQFASACGHPFLQDAGTQRARLIFERLSEIAALAQAPGDEPGGEAGPVTPESRSPRAGRDYRTGFKVKQNLDLCRGCGFRPVGPTTFPR